MEFQFGRGTKLDKLRRHGRSAQHVQNARSFFNAPPHQGVSDGKAPSMHEFHDALKHLQSGNGCTKLDGVAGKTELSQMEFTMVETMRSVWREQLRNAVSITLMRDERHKRMLVIFRSVNASLNVTEGVLGQAKGTYSSSALGLGEATMKLITDFCTLGTKTKQEVRATDMDLVTHIRLHVHCTTVDAASNEVCAVQDSAAPLEAGNSILAEVEVAFPNHRLVIRDKAHEARRVLSRPWKADPILDAIVCSVVTGRNSICQIIPN